MSDTKLEQVSPLSVQNEELWSSPSALQTSRMNQILPLPKISIVTPSYNQSQYPETTIRSVLGQGYPNLEFIILDAGSSDGSVDIIKKYEHLLAYWRSGADDGPYSAVNEGLRRSTGDIFAWLNSDDYFFPNSLAFVADAFSEFTAMNWLTTTTQGKMNALGELSAVRISGVSRDSFAAGAHLPGAARHYIGVIQQESTFFRSELWREVGGIRTEFSLAGDFALWCDFMAKQEVYTTTKLLGAFRGHDTNRSKNINRYCAEAECALHDYRHRISWRPQRLREAISTSKLARFNKIVGRFGYRGIRIDRRISGGVSTWIENQYSYF